MIYISHLPELVAFSILSSFFGLPFQAFGFDVLTSPPNQVALAAKVDRFVWVEELERSSWSLHHP
jgi:hypothetical protein